ncbi:Crp/Fnr family transcriptional regulator [Chryseobacterium fistulae]|uniref:cAMP-activated global transcriptional regulator CRP n=1 Tax=Chryseobacterium fistulae TaxID=2675058 RepID=A0A6N4XZ70_9FLAO|nr:Crp/Fnr family transcriptional regulator [Chryseobacterium fistulae]CAA7390967.1 cAMP-activated global transcriptional regulator CRP [Chryseobacterium fistulae]
MNINRDLLLSSGAEVKTYKTGELIFREGDHAFYYFQIERGKIKLNSYNEEGNEFIQNIIGEKQSFGESFLFLDRLYVMNAICLENAEIIRLSKPLFIELLKATPHLSMEMNTCLSERLYHKVFMLQNISSQNPILRIIGLLNYLKSFHDTNCGQFQVELTRQQLANLVGLRVETVIRTIKKMEKEGKIKIENRKILY